jgi:hypothetical protein
MTFNPSEHLVKIKTKQGMQDYLKVQHRLVWFRENCPEGIIETEMVHLDTEKQIAVFKAIAHNGNGALAMGHGSESARDFMDYIEKAETKAIGRALAALGFGTQFTADELDEGTRIVDSPVERMPAQPESYIPINAPTPRELRERHKFLGMKDDFETVVFKMFKKHLTDDELSPERCIALSGVLERFYEQKASRKEA